MKKVSRIHGVITFFVFFLTLLTFTMVPVQVASARVAAKQPVEDPGPQPLQFKCGDANGDGVLTTDDATFLQNYVDTIGSAPVPFVSGDINRDDVIDEVDVSLLSAALLTDYPAVHCPRYMPCADFTKDGYLSDKDVYAYIQGQSIVSSLDPNDFNEDGRLNSLDVDMLRSHIKEPPDIDKNMFVCRKEYVSCIDPNQDNKTGFKDYKMCYDYMMRSGEMPQDNIRCDYNADGEPTISDLAYLINYFFRNAPKPMCVE